LSSARPLRGKKGEKKKETKASIAAPQVVIRKRKENEHVLHPQCRNQKKAIGQLSARQHGEEKDKSVVRGKKPNISLFTRIIISRFRVRKGKRGQSGSGKGLRPSRAEPRKKKKKTIHRAVCLYPPDERRKQVPRVSSKRKKRPKLGLSRSA